MVTAKDVPPGGVGEIKATFKSKGYNGAVTKTVTVETNDPKNRSVRLTMKGKVVAEVTVDPRYVNFGDIEKDKAPDAKTLRIDLRQGRNLRIEEVNSENPKVLLTKLKEDANGAEYSVALAKDIPTGRVTGNILIKTNSEKNPKVEVAVHAFVKGNVQAFPQVLSLGLVPPGEKATGEITLRATLGKPFSVKEVKSSSDRLKVDVKAEKQGDIYKIAVRYDASGQEEGRISEKLTIVTQNGEREIVQVPVYGAVKPKAQAR